MAWELLIRDGQVVTRDGVERLDLAIEDGRIVEISSEIVGSAREEIDAAGLHVFPGVIDSHVHFNEPGRTDWEGIATGSAALVAGGGTCFFDMPLNSSPPVLDGETFDRKLELMRQKSLADFSIWGGLTPINLDRLEELSGRGVIAFKAFMCDSGIDEFPFADDQTLQRGMTIAAKLGRIVAVHAEDQEMTARLTETARNSGGRDVEAYLQTRPAEAEIAAIERAIAIAESTRCKLHVVHVSTSAGVDRVSAARRRGVDVTCETCPHYLVLTASDLRLTGAVAKCAPPLRDHIEFVRLWQRLADGAIEFVASDHSPAPPEMKTSDDFFQVWGGIAGVQSTLAIMLTRRDKLDVPAVARITAKNVAARFGVACKGRIEVGCDADLALVDLAEAWELRSGDLFDRHKLSPYVGGRFKGKVRRTIVRGSTVFADGKIVGARRGRLVRSDMSG